MNFKRCLFILLFCVLFAGAPAKGQDPNPPVAACGLPAQGTIWQSAVYTLTANCVLTGTLSIPTADPMVEVTINGAGHIISGGAFGLFFGSAGILNLNDVTINGGFVARTYVIHVGTLDANQATFTRAFGGPMLLARQVSLNNVLLAWNIADHYSLGGNGSALHLQGNSNWTLNNVVVHNNLGGGGAIGILPGASLTTNGCLTLSGNAPYDVYEGTGTWTDNSTGLCSGAIGNGGQTVVPPQIMPCGLPAFGNLDVSATYRLTANCVLARRLYISENVIIRIEGNGYTISTSLNTTGLYIAATSTLELNNVAFAGLRMMNFGSIRANRFKMTDVNDGIINMGEARFTNALFENNSTAFDTSRSVLLAYGVYRNGFSSFTDTIFRNNHGGVGLLRNAGGAIELNGCITFENNTPANISGAFTDNSTGPCSSIDLPQTPEPPALPNTPSLRAAQPSANALSSGPEGDCLRLGAIGLLCRLRGQPPEVVVWGITQESEGFFIFSATQRQVEAVAQGMVACSLDGRTALRNGLVPEVFQQLMKDPDFVKEWPVPRRYIIASMGPNWQGKVHHIVIDHALGGRVLGTVDTFDGPPAAECIPAQQAAALPAQRQVANAFPVQRQPAQPDGSIIHVVQPNDTINMIAVAYRVSAKDIIRRNNLGNRGNLIFPGQEIVIR